LKWAGIDLEIGTDEKLIRDFEAVSKGKKINRNGRTGI
jgi:hypothetical protein